MFDSECIWIVGQLRLSGMFSVKAGYIADLTCLVLKFSRQHVHPQLDERVRWGQDIAEEEESNQDRPFITEAERVIQRLVVDENIEQCEDIEQMALGDQKKF